jgi:nucleoside-diphosphate-sugar epimerase
MPITLVTGIHGFTGQYLAKHLQAAGHEVHGVTRQAGETDHVGGTSVHVCDLLDRDRLASLIANIRPNYVVHLAAVAFVAHDDLAEMYRTNILGTRMLLETCADASSSLRAVLVASSANIYGNASAGVLDETAPVRPANDYAVTKAAVENLVHIYSERLPIVIVRPFNYTGVGQSEAFLIPKIISHIRRRATVIELGNLDVARDISDVRTVVAAYARLLDAPDSVGGTFNICSGKAYTLHEVISLASALAQHQIKVSVNPALVRANEVKLLQGSKMHLESVIGSLDMPPLAQTLRWMIEA